MLAILLLALLLWAILTALIYSFVSRSVFDPNQSQGNFSPRQNLSPSWHPATIFEMMLILMS